MMIKISTSLAMFELLRYQIRTNLKNAKYIYFLFGRLDLLNRTDPRNTDNWYLNSYRYRNSDMSVVHRVTFVSRSLSFVNTFTSDESRRVPPILSGSTSRVSSNLFTVSVVKQRRFVCEIVRYYRNWSVSNLEGAEPRIWENLYI
jgi:hypothetical protein